MAASRADKIEIFKLFLAEERVDVNLVSSKDDISVLMCSLWNFNEEAARLLLKEPRVNVNWMNSKGMSALHVVAAAEKNHQALVSSPKSGCELQPVSDFHNGASRCGGKKQSRGGEADFG